MRVAALRVELLIPGPRSIKEKRAVLRPTIEGIKRIGSFSVAEVDHHDAWQRSTIGVAVVAPDGRGLEMQLDKLRRYLDGRYDIEVVDIFKSELEEPE